IPTVDLRIMKEKKSDIKGDPGNVDLEIGNVSDDLGATNADLEKRLQINELYSQGATNILNFTYQDNCDANTPATIPFYLDDDVVNVNTIELTFRTKKFRAYSQATHGGGALVKSTGGGGGIVKSTKGGGGTTRSTTSGGGTTATSSNGGGVAKSTASGGGTTATSSTKVFDVYLSNTGPDKPSQAGGHVHLMEIPGSSFTHSHTVNVPSHTHSFDVPSHSHSVTIPNHSHSVTIPDHTH